jgi:hypothetical protein
MSSFVYMLTIKEKRVTNAYKNRERCQLGSNEGGFVQFIACSQCKAVGDCAHYRLHSDNE